MVAWVPCWRSDSPLQESPNSSFIRQCSPLCWAFPSAISAPCHFLPLAQFKQQFLGISLCAMEDVWGDLMWTVVRDVTFRSASNTNFQYAGSRGRGQWCQEEGQRLVGLISGWSWSTAQPSPSDQWMSLNVKWSRSEDLWAKPLRLMCAF